MARVFGDAVRAVRFFRFGWFDFQGVRIAVARSGYSKQGGYEIYVDGTKNGMALWNALLRVAKEGPTQQIRAIAIDGNLPVCDQVWPLMVKGKRIGQVTSAVKSPDYKTNVAIGMVRMTHWDEGTALEVHTHAGPRAATVRENFWI